MLPHALAVGTGLSTAERGAVAWERGIVKGRSPSGSGQVFLEPPAVNAVRLAVILQPQMTDPRLRGSRRGVLVALIHDLVLNHFGRLGAREDLRRA